MSGSLSDNCRTAIKNHINDGGTIVPGSRNGYDADVIAILNSKYDDLSRKFDHFMKIYEKMVDVAALPKHDIKMLENIDLSSTELKTKSTPSHNTRKKNHAQNRPKVPLNVNKKIPSNNKINNNKGFLGWLKSKF